jgi:hypothetical protein
MKANKKFMELLNHGFSDSLLSSLNENQIDSLHQRLEESKKENKEATTKTSTTTTFDPSNESDRKAMEDLMGKKGIPVTVDPATKKMTVVVEDGETTESEESDTDLALAVQSQEVSEKFESKKQQKYFWWKCGDGKTKEQKKWCKMAKEFSDSTKSFNKLPEKVKKDTNEEFGMGDYTKKLTSVLTNNLENAAYKMVPNPTFGENILDKKISTLVEKHLPPKMNKRDLIKMISEAEKEVEIPVKPDVKPERPKPQTPYQPKHKPAPKAGEKEVETPVKPDVKPERPKPQTPYQPKHKPAPKAEDVPQWLTFDAIGINLK